MSSVSLQISHFDQAVKLSISKLSLNTKEMTPLLRKVIFWFSEKILHAFYFADRQNFRQNNTAILMLQKSARTMRGVLSLNLCVIKFLTKKYLIAFQIKAVRVQFVKQSMK